MLTQRRAMAYLETNFGDQLLEINNFVQFYLQTDVKTFFGDQLFQRKNFTYLVLRTKHFFTTVIPFGGITFPSKILSW